MKGIYIVEDFFSLQILFWNNQNARVLQKHSDMKFVPKKWLRRIFGQKHLHNKNAELGYVVIISPPSLTPNSIHQPDHRASNSLCIVGVQIFAYYQYGGLRAYTKDITLCQRRKTTNTS